jgi:hypothetical protein
LALLAALFASSLPVAAATCPMARDEGAGTRISAPDCCANQKCPMLQNDVARPPASITSISPASPPVAARGTFLPAQIAMAPLGVASPQTIGSPPRSPSLRI